MSEGKKSFVLYDDYWEHIELLTGNERSELFTAIFAYRGMCEMPALSSGAKIAFSFIRSQMDRDMAKYTAVCERNRQNGAKGGRPPKNPLEPTETQANPNNPLGYQSDAYIVPSLGFREITDDATEEKKRALKELLKQCENPE